MTDARLTWLSWTSPVLKVNTSNSLKLFALSTTSTWSRSLTPRSWVNGLVSARSTVTVTLARWLLALVSLLPTLVKSPRPWTFFWTVSLLNSGRDICCRPTESSVIRLQVSLKGTKSTSGGRTIFFLHFPIKNGFSPSVLLVIPLCS